MMMTSALTSGAQIQRPQQGPPPTGQGLTDKLDQDNNGSLSVTEIEETRLAEMIGDRFTEMDSDGDGGLSVQELDDALAANRPTEGQGPPPPPPPSGAGGGDGASGMAMDALFEGLFAALDVDSSDSAETDIADMADQLYAMMQDIWANQASV